MILNQSASIGDVLAICSIFLVVGIFLSVWIAEAIDWGQKWMDEKRVYSDWRTRREKK